MELPTVERVKAAYAAHPELRPVRQVYLCQDFMVGRLHSTQWCGCPLTACVIHETGHGIAAICASLTVFADLHEKIAEMTGLDRNEIRCFTRGVDGDDDGRPPHIDARMHAAYERGVEVRKAIWPEFDRDV